MSPRQKLKQNGDKQMGTTTNYSSKKAKYKIKNWSEYNKALKQRGSLIIWFSPESISKWKHQGEAQQGAQFQYSDLSIETMLTVKLVYNLAFRQLEGFMSSIAKLLKLNIRIPNYSTVCRRQKGLSVKLPVRKKNEFVHLVVDSSGVKVFGEGEWKVRQHGYSKRRTWRKIHLAIDEATGEILSGELTANSIHDSHVVSTLLSDIERDLEAFGGDGAYDRREVYDAVKQRAETQDSPIQVLIPPRKDAVIWQHGNSSEPTLRRDENLRYIRKHGRKSWKMNSGYHRRSLAETAMFRYKKILGAELSARLFANQKIEFQIGIKILNQMAFLGMPVSVLEC